MSDVLKDTWQGEPRPTAEPVTVKLDNRDATFTPTGPAHFPAQPATAVVGGSEPAGETTGRDEMAMHTPKGSTGDVFLDPTPSDPIAPRRIGGLVMLPTAELDELRAEHVQMHVQLARIRALHRQYRDVYATDETGDSCAHCNTFTDAWRVPWPCPTIQALDDPVFPAPDKET